MMFKLRKLRPTQQVRFLIAFVGVAVALNIGVAVYVLFKGFRPLSYNVEVNPPAQFDLSFLDVITNHSYQVAQFSTNSVAPSVSTMSPRLPIVFDSYCELRGVPYALFSGHAFKVGDFLNGRMVESISPWAVVVEGQVYEIRKKEKGVTNERVPTPSAALSPVD